MLYNDESKSQNADDSFVNHKSIFSSGKLDIVIIMLVIVLVSLGVVFIFSVTSVDKYLGPYFYFTRQGIFAILGIVIMFLFSVIDYHALLKFSVPFYLITIILLIVVLFMHGVQGAHRYMIAPGLVIQPASLSLVSTTLLLAKILSSKRFRNINWANFFALLIITSVPLGLIIIEPFLVFGALLLCIFFVFIFIKSPKYSCIIISSFIINIIILLIFQPSYLNKRLEVWMDPFSAPYSYGYQTIQSMYAIASGGLFGVGLGNGNAKIFLPSVSSDYILAGITEEIGLIGAFFVVLLFALLLWRIIVIAMRSEDILGFYLSVGIFSYFAFQILFHVLVVVNAIPSAGFSLPFISYGSNSLIIELMLMGIMLNISRNTKKRNY